MGELVERPDDEPQPEAAEKVVIPDLDHCSADREFAQHPKMGTKLAGFGARLGA
ncbi:hypothetical protein [Microtetraspora malaysiensis]|uniref:hypothetical protein n=1 Tax=Microtetraspora malaysiensis TaxID=161358 RepID=UPI003D9360EA